MNSNSQLRQVVKTYEYEHKIRPFTILCAAQCIHCYYCSQHFPTIVDETSDSQRRRSSIDCRIELNVSGSGHTQDNNNISTTRQLSAVPEINPIEQKDPQSGEKRNEIIESVERE